MYVQLDVRVKNSECKLIIMPLYLLKTQNAGFTLNNKMKINIVEIKNVMHTNTWRH